MPDDIDLEIARFRGAVADAASDPQAEFSARVDLAERLLARLEGREGDATWADHEDAAEAAGNIEFVLRRAGEVAPLSWLVVAADVNWGLLALGHDPVELSRLAGLLDVALSRLADDDPSLVDAAVALGRIAISRCEAGDLDNDPRSAVAHLLRAMTVAESAQAKDVSWMIGSVLVTTLVWTGEGGPADRDMAVEFLTSAIEGESQAWWVPDALQDLGGLHYGRWQDFRDPADLDAAIALGRRLVAALEGGAGASTGKTPVALIWLGNALADRCEHAHNDEDRDAAISAIGQGLRSSESIGDWAREVGHARRGLLLASRAEQSGSWADLDEAISELTTARELLPADSDLHLVVLGALCATHAERGLMDPANLDDADLAAAVKCGDELGDQGEVVLGHGRNVMVGLALAGRAKLGTIGHSERERCIEMLAAAERRLSKKDDWYSQVQFNLGVMIGDRGQRRRDATDMKCSVDILTKVHELISSGNPLRANVVAVLANAMADAINLGGLPTSAYDQALELISEVLDDPSLETKQRASLLGVMGHLYLGRAQTAKDTFDIDRCIAALTELDRLAPEDSADRVELLFHLANILLTRFLRNGELRDVEVAIGHLDHILKYVEEAELDFTQLQVDMEPGILRALRGSAQGMQAVFRGDMDELNAAISVLRDEIHSIDPNNTQRTKLEDHLKYFELVRSMSSRDPAVWARAADQAEKDLAELPISVDPDIGLTRLKVTIMLLLGLARSYEKERMARVIDELRGGIEASKGFAELNRRFATVLGMAYHVRYHYERDLADLDEALSWLERMRAEYEDRPGNPVAAQIHMVTTRIYRDRATGAQPTEPAQGEDAYRDTALARARGLAALREYARVVLLQSGAENALAAAHAAAEDALDVTRWMLADGAVEGAIHALELGRGLVLHAATSAAGVSDRLCAAGCDELAAAWDEVMEKEDEVPGSLSGTADAGWLMALSRSSFPDDLRTRVIRALVSHRQVGVDLFTPPAISDIAGALRRTGMDALVYLIAGTRSKGGWAIWVTATEEVHAQSLPVLFIEPDGRFPGYIAAHQALWAADEDAAEGAYERWRAALLDLCGWAGRCAMRPVLKYASNLGFVDPPRLILVPVGELGRIPWHAARIRFGGSERRAIEHAVISYASSARQLIEVAARDRLAYGIDPVIVVDPTGDLEGAAAEAEAFARCYPNATVLRSAVTIDGRRGGGVFDALPATAEDVLARIPGQHGGGASVLHLACHGRVVPGSPTESHLELATEEPLTIARILAQAKARPAGAPGGLVLLAACVSGLTETVYDEALAMTTAFHAAGAVTTIGTLWEVDDFAAATLLFQLHQNLVNGLPPVDALRSAQLWALDPERRPPPGMPVELALGAGDAVLSDITSWGAFAHQGV